MKYISLIIALLLPSTVMAQDSLQVFACEPEWGALVKELGGERVSVFTATHALQDPHHIQARPSLIAKARRADLLVCTGAELEVGWLPLLQRKAGNPRIQDGADGFFMATDYVALTGAPQRLDRSEGDIHAAGNPHIHLNPHLIAEVAIPLSQRLQQLDHEHSDFYQQRYHAFKQKWATAIQQWEAKAAPLKGKKVVVYHNHWVYLNQWLGLEQVATIEAKPGIPPSSGDLSRLLTQMKNNPAELIIYAAYQSSRSAEWLANKTGIPVTPLAATTDENQLFSFFDNLISTLLQEHK